MPLSWPRLHPRLRIYPHLRKHPRRVALGAIAAAAIGTPLGLVRLLDDSPDAAPADLHDHPPAGAAAARAPRSGASPGATPSPTRKPTPSPTASATPTRSAPPAARKPSTPPAVAGLRAVWSPVPGRDGLAAFERLEDDRFRSHPGTKHITVQGDTFRFDMHARDREGRNRQRHEAKGMRAGDIVVDMLADQTWRITYDMFIPTALQGTSNPTHVFQLKRPGGGRPALATISLQREDGAEFLAFRGFASAVAGQVPLAPLRNRWLGVDMTFGVNGSGTSRFVIRDGARTVLDTQRAIDLRPGDRLRPKWGIDRTLRNAGRLADGHLLLRTMRAYVDR